MPSSDTQIALSTLNPISCERCRRKKIRCNRIQPACATCISSLSVCSYPSRKRRTVKRETTTCRQSTTHSNSTCIDQDPSSRITDMFVPADAKQNLTFGALLFSHGNINTSQSNDTTTYQSSQRPSLSSYVFPLLELELYRLKSGLNLPGFAYDIHDTVPDILDELSLGSLRPVWDRYRALLEANGHVSIAKNDSTNSQLPKPSSSAAVKTRRDPINPLIKAHLAKQMMTEYFALVTYLDDFIDKPMMMLIPDLLERQHIVTLSPAIMIVYYGLLYYILLLMPEQAFLQLQQSEATDSRHVCLSLYEACVQFAASWEQDRNSEITTVDFGAAYLMAWMAIENVDWQLAWKYFCLTCVLGRHLGFLDPKNYTEHAAQNLPAQNSVIINSAKKLNCTTQQDLFCSLLELEYYFRNFHGMPRLLQHAEYTSLLHPLQQFVLRVKNVNGPSLADEIMQVAHARTVCLQTQMINDLDPGTPTDYQESTESLADKILQIDQELQLRDRFFKSTWTQGKWLYADALLGVYASINFVYNRPGLYKRTRPLPLQFSKHTHAAVDSLVILRSLVNAMGDTQQGHPWCDHFMSTHGAVAYSTLFKGLLTGTHEHESSHHVDLMLWYQQALSMLVKNSKKMSDLERWAINLNEFGQRVIGAKILSFPLIPRGYRTPTPVPEPQPTITEYEVNAEETGQVSTSLVAEFPDSIAPELMDFDALFGEIVDADSWDSSIFQSIGLET